MRGLFAVRKTQGWACTRGASPADRAAEWGNQQRKDLLAQGMEYAVPSANPGRLDGKAAHSSTVQAAASFQDKSRPADLRRSCRPPISPQREKRPALGGPLVGARGQIFQGRKTRSSNRGEGSKGCYEGAKISHRREPGGTGREDSSAAEIIGRGFPQSGLLNPIQCPSAHNPRPALKSGAKESREGLGPAQGSERGVHRGGREGGRRFASCMLAMSTKPLPTLDDSCGRALF